MLNCLGCPTIGCLVVTDEEHNGKVVLHKISEVDRYGAFEGVEFDLRHELLDPAE